MQIRTVTCIAISVVLPIAATAQPAPETRTVNNGNVVLENVPAIPEGVQELLERYENVRSAGFADWSADGSTMYISTRFGATNQLHRVAMAGGARTQITFYDEPVNSAQRRPDGSELLFSRDVGGGEFFQLYLLDPRSGAARRLTDGRSRNTGASWSPDGKRISFTSTRRDGRSNDLWVLGVDDTASAKMVLQSPDGTSWGVADWHPRSDTLLVLNYVSANDSRVHLLDQASGKTRALAGGGTKPASYSGITPTFTADGRGVFVATDASSEFTQLALIDVANGRTEIITRDIPWDVESFELSEDGKRAAFTVNEGGIGRLYLMDPATRRYSHVESIPQGIIGLGEFSPDGKWLSITINSARTPSDVYTLELGSGALDAGPLTRWTTSEVGGLDPEQFVEPTLIEYPTFDRVNGQPRKIPAFVYKPRTGGPHPVIVQIHGGPEGQSRPGFSSSIQAWVKALGTAVIVPNVRGSTGYGKTYLRLDNAELRENSVKDIGALLDWIATQPDLDAGRVAVYGGSYGGYMVLASAMHYSDRLRAAVDIVGISNFVTFLQNTQGYRRDLRRAEYGDERDPRMRAVFDSISPGRHASRIRVPLFVAAGQNDPRVPVSESEAIARAVRGNGQPVWTMIAMNEGHGFAKKENRDLFNQIVVMFFREHLLPKQAAEGASFRREFVRE
jgi:dipeptidyl aminopeptidase/acylaminoacyl peptidase